MKTLYNTKTAFFAFIVIAGAALSIALTQPVAAASGSLSANSYLTSKQTQGVPGKQAQTDFNCSDEVYLVVETAANEGLEASSHELTVHWYNPSGKIEQRTVYEFTQYHSGSRVWAWLRLSGPPGAAIARLFDPAFGMGGFIGTWKVEVKIDKKKIANHKFEVLC